MVTPYIFPYNISISTYTFQSVCMNEKIFILFTPVIQKVQFLFTYSINERGLFNSNETGFFLKKWQNCKINNATADNYNLYLYSNIFVYFLTLIDLTMS